MTAASEAMACWEAVKLEEELELLLWKLLLLLEELCWAAAAAAADC